MDINVTGDYTQHGDNVINKYVTINEAEPSRQALNTYIANRLAEFRKPETTEKYISLHFKIHLSKKESWISTNPAEIDPPNFMILGEIGCGKSTVLRKLALKAFEEQPAHKKLPIFLDLSTWPDGQEFEIFVKEYLKVHLGYELLFPCTQWVLFLDSLNEMSGDVELKINQLKQFLERYNLGQPNGIQAIIACQYKSYLNYGKPFSLPYTLIQELTEEQIGQYIGGENKSIQTLLNRKFIKTPFQLAIINRLLQENSETDFEAYENFSQVFEAYINQVLMNQKNQKKYYYAPYVPELDILKNCLGKLAFDMQKGQEGSTVSAGFALKSLASTLNLNVNINFVEKIKSLFSKSAAPLLTSVADQAQKTPHIFILRIAEKTGLIQIDKKGLTVQFTHEFYQKYFMAYFLTTQWQVYIKKNPQLYLGYSHFAGRGQGEKWDTGELREPQTWDEVWVVLVGLLNKAEQYYFLQFVTDYDPVLATEIIKKAGLSLENYRFIEKTLWECLEFENGYRKCDFGTTVYALSNFPTDETIKKLTQLLCEREYQESIISRSLWQIGQTIGMNVLLQKMQLAQKPDKPIIWTLLTHTPLEDEFLNNFIFFDAQCFFKLDNYELRELIHPWRTNNIQNLYVANANELAKLIKQNKKGVIEFLWIKEQSIGEAWEYLLELAINSDELIDSNMIHIALAGIFTNPYINSEKSTSYVIALLNHKTPLVQETTVEFLHANKILPRYIYSPPVYEPLIKQIKDNIYSNISILSKLFDMWLSYFKPVDWDNKIYSKFDPQPKDPLPLVNSLHEVIYQALWEVSPNSLLGIIESKIPYIMKQGYDIGVVLHLLGHCRFVGSKERYSSVNHKIHSNLCHWLINIYSSNSSSASISHALTIIKPPSALSIFIEKAKQSHYRCILALAEMDLGEHKNEVVQLLYDLMRQQQSGVAIKALTKLGEDITKELMDLTELATKDFEKYSFYFVPELLSVYEDLNKNSLEIIEGLQKLIRVIPFKGGMNGEDHILSVIKLLDKLAPETAWQEIFILLERFYETTQLNHFEYLDGVEAITFIFEYLSKSNKVVTVQQKDLLVNIGEVIYTFREKKWGRKYDDSLGYVIYILGVQKINKAIPFLQKILDNTHDSLSLQQKTVEALGQFKNAETTKILCQVYASRENYHPSNHDKVAGWITEQIVVWGSQKAFKLLFDTLEEILKEPGDFWENYFWEDYFLTDVYQVIRIINDASVLGNLITEWGKIPDVQLSEAFAKGCFLHMPQAIPQLVKFIIEQDSPHRLLTVQLLIYMHIQAETFQKPLNIQYIYNELAKLREDADVQVRQEVNLYLGRYGDARAIEGLIRMILNDEDDVTDDFKQQQYRLELQEKCIALLVNIDSSKAKEELYSLAQNSNRHIKTLARKGLKFLKEREEEHKVFIPPLATS